MADGETQIQHLSTFIFLAEILDDEEECMEIEHKQSLGLHLNLQKKRSEMPKVNNYMRVIDDMTFMYQNIDDFKLHYRLHRDTFDIVLNEVFIWLHIAYRGGSLPIEPDKQLLVFLNYLGNQQSMRECAHLFGLSKSTVHRVIHSVTSALLQIKDKVIRWPNGEEQKEIAREVQRNCGIQGVVGFIDGTHIKLASAPVGDRNFYNRKGYPSMQLQVNNSGCCGQLQIISAYTGWPGCTHDARVLRNSHLYHNADSGRSFIQDHQLLADNAYPLGNWLISPYKNENSNTDINDLVDDITQIYLHAATKTIMLKAPNLKRKRKKTRKLWMSGDCLLLRKEVRSLGRKLMKEPKNANLQNSFVKARREYNKLKKNLRRKFFSELCQKINDISPRDSKIFWKEIDQCKQKNLRMFPNH